MTKKTTKNDITGDTLITKETTDKYRDNYDKIFRKKPLTFWSHYCTMEQTELSVESGAPCNWCEKTEEDFLD